VCHEDNAKYYKWLEYASKSATAKEMGEGFMDSFVAQTKKKSVVILENSPINKSNKFMAIIEEWKEQDVLIFFLPPYSPELNLIEILWRRI